MANEVKLEIGYGLGKGDDAFAIGVETARQALAGIRECALSLVLVFASSRYDLKELLRGVHSIVGDVPVVGATTAGEICNGPHHDSVVVTVLASPYLEVAVGLGRGVSESWQEAVAQAVSAPGLAPFFSPDDDTAWSRLTLEGKSAFAFMFAPGETFTSILRTFEILEKLKRLSQDRLPVIGGAAGDDLRMAANYVLYGGQAYPDSLLLVMCMTQLRFGIAMAHGLKPTAQRVMVTQSHNHEVLELDGQTAADAYSKILGHSRESLEGKHLTLLTGAPLGTLDPYGQYSINVAAYFTPNGGLRVAQPVTEGTILTLMEATPESVIAAGREALRKALLRGSITQAAIVLVFSCCLRACFLGDRLAEETQGMQQILPEVPYTGFYSMGEQGLADDCVNRNNTEVIAVLVLGRELSYAAKVALEREGLRREVEQAEALKVAYAALEREVAERKRAEGTLLESEKRFRDVAENAQEWVWEVDAEGKYTYTSPIVEKLLGYKPEEILDKHFYDIFLPKEREELKKMAFATFFAKQPIREFVNPNLHKNGSIVWLSTSGVPILDKMGNFSGYRGADIDITERKLAEEELRESEQRFRTIFKLAADGILLADVDTKKFLMGNERVSRMLGYSLDEIRQLGVMDIHPAEALPHVLKQFERQVKQEIAVAQDIPVKRKDGCVFYADVNAFPMIIEGKAYSMAIFHDTTARRQAEEEIIRQREELRGLATRLAEVEELERKKLAGELHDGVCQNLANIGITLEILKLRTPQGPMDQWLARLQEASELVEQTGEITRNIMEGLRPTVLDHYGLVGGLRQLGNLFSQRTGIDLEFRGEEPGFRLKPDVELALFRIAQEALNNVAKHARASRVVVTEKVGQDKVSLTVEDNGTGFDLNLVSKPIEGRGWGLVIMNERAKAVGGHCRIETQPGQGTRLTVEVSR